MKVNCDYCGKPAKLVDSKIIYGRSYGMVWYCKPCDAYVGCYKNSEDHKPLGRLANKQLRNWKKIAHKYFDVSWKAGSMSRSRAYAWLSKKLQVEQDKCHIGMFDVSLCMKVYEICKAGVFI